MTTRRNLLAAVPAIAAASTLPVATAEAYSSGETGEQRWDDVLDRLERAADALEIPRDELEAVLAAHGGEFRAWIEDEDIKGESFTCFTRFCHKKGVSLDWLFFGDEASLLRYARIALTR